MSGAPLVINAGPHGSDHGNHLGQMPKIEPKIIPAPLAGIGIVGPVCASGFGPDCAERWAIWPFGEGWACHLLPFPRFPSRSRHWDHLSRMRLIRWCDRPHREALLTLNLVGEITGKPRWRVPQECPAQARPNVVTGFFGAWAAAPWIGQSK